MTQAQVSGLAGVTQGYISQVEAGRKSVDRRSTLIAIADALQVTLADLFEAPGDPADPQRDRADAAMPAIRVILAEIEEGERRPPVLDRNGMEAAAEELSRHRLDANYPTMAGILATLLPDAAAYGTTYLARVGCEATTCLSCLGYRDLALPMSRIALRGAEESGDPAWIGAARFLHAIVLPMEAPALAARAAGRALSEMQAVAGDPRARQMLGQLHLSAALSSAVSGADDDARAHLAEAAKEAGTLGDPADGVGFAALGFGPTNVDLWRMTLALESGESGRVVELAAAFDPRALRLADRHAAYWTTYGRALAHSGKNDPQALAALTRAEHATPAAFARSQPVRDTLVALTYRAQRRGITPPLLTLNRRAGIDMPA